MDGWQGGNMTDIISGDIRYALPQNFLQNILPRAMHDPNVLIRCRLEDFVDMLLKRKRGKSGFNGNVVSKDCDSDLPEITLTKQISVDSVAMIKVMYNKDFLALDDRNPAMMSHHPELTPAMRSVVVDWLMQVCTELKLFRQTFYLTIDLLDRYVSKKRKIRISRLQLIAITCLLVATKVEEIQIPKLKTLALICEGCYTEKEIIRQEIRILHTLDWKTSDRITVIDWLGVYMKMVISNRIRPIAEIWDDMGICKIDTIKQYLNFPKIFEQVTMLTDLCTLDIDMNRYSYHVIAASAMNFVLGREIAYKLSGLEWTNIEQCVQWMEPFYLALVQEGLLPVMNLGETLKGNQVKSGFIDPSKDDIYNSYIKQKYIISIAIYTKAIFLKRHQMINTSHKDNLSVMCDTFCSMGCDCNRGSSSDESRVSF